MKIQRLVLLSMVVLGALPGAGTLSVSAKEKAPSKELLAQAKLSRADAEKIALTAVPNATVKEAELEDEDGGLRWSFDLKTPGTKKITEVGVNAVTGKIVENKVENEKGGAKEKDGDKDDEKSAQENGAH